MPVVYAYFACSMRNRLEVWRSDRFQSPMEEAVQVESEQDQHQVQADSTCPCLNGACPHKVPLEGGDPDIMGAPPEAPDPDVEKAIPKAPTSSASVTLTRDRSDSTASQAEKHTDTNWNQVDMRGAGIFTVRRPTKLIDGSRGGQAFICEVFCPKSGQAYGVEEQARLQFLSVVLVVAGLAKDQSSTGILEMLWKISKSGADWAWYSDLCCAYGWLSIFLSLASCLSYSMPSGLPTFSVGLRRTLSSCALSYPGHQEL
ncbi:hypothetical protein LTS07_006220 [Exophiala sideris]|uniref:Uncharacterized protein n=1 Tax=Exophiala sideris TaxID=1016849 RepID=A0ABR0J895_9EURO|nr:hypothetical protein LTS07_006220 [Exophiala sideris]KAK5035709.1 hypothetical protein LTR13_005839 [Exophiala sideris]KAK5057344.1 hypothetical protein LTR69_007384 [Exophiala sideris]KAK5181682.1 hypothetical protein LTR44_005881 [Eurotiomycetes sp. CCFEE 6388]